VDVDGDGTAREPRLRAGAARPAQTQTAAAEPAASTAGPGIPVGVASDSAAGKLADYVVLAEDLHSIPVDKIKDVKIVRTVVGGKAVYEG